MKNLFDYASKELSQDAFLRWLFENHDCENESVRNAFWRLFNNFTDDKLKGKHITDLVTVAQWKGIDVSIWFKVDGVEHLIVIEDKTDSNMHSNQLARYTEQIAQHNSCWKEHWNPQNHKLIRYVEKDENIFKVFYKTNIVDSWEKEIVEKSGWKLYDIYLICELFADVRSSNEILDCYIEHIKKIHSDAKREKKPSEWNLVSWHSFFNDYQSYDCISKEKDIGCYKNEYYYIKFLVEGHRGDMPCLEVRSRDFKKDKDSGKWSIIVRAVLYNLSHPANIEDIKLWQTSLEKNGFCPNYRKDPSRHKQIGTICIDDMEDTEQALLKGFDRISNLMLTLF